MFICQLSGKLSKPGEKAVKLVTKTRPKVYFEKDKKTGEQRKVGEGSEIVQELTVTEASYRRYMKERCQDANE